ncbi:hypothetical protein HanXRQr2_Chr04g0190801 [Helianthus annuus]|uniref:Uncharacterized protein n=1 Tax=Helianthus annuus TaxID=4232 RepID=A0A9K3JCB8_HELAN|nr:hypothetical protein HanXRQr2_Chr04g0190801 [Helianthus annuus]KAJ0933395.1 hypothetical protein HanPSC8_Chr04g0184301 [Helianthus annuus]
MEVRPPPSWPGAVRSSISPPSVTSSPSSSCRSGRSKRGQMFLTDIYIHTYNI